MLRSSRLAVVLALALLSALPAAARTSTQFLVAPDAAPGARFGASLDGAGDTLVVGAPGAGAVYVFRNPGDGWVLEARLSAGDPGDELGAAMALDGDVLLVGAPGRAGSTGGGWIFVRTAGTWSAPVPLVADGATPGSRVGAAVDLAGDLAVLGAPGADAEAGGAVGFVGGATTWALAGAVLAGAGVQAGDRAGWSIATDGFTIVAGAPGRDCGASPDCGIAFVAQRATTGFAAAGTLASTTLRTNDRFGTAVDLRGDDLAIGSPAGRVADRNSIITYPGAVEMFRRSGVGFEPTTRLSSFGPGNTRGTSVRIAGTRVVSGGPFTEGPADVFGEAAGLRVAFRVGSGWTDAAESLIPDVDEDILVETGLGTAVAFTDTGIAGGAPRMDGDAGRVYLFSSRPPVFGTPATATPTAASLLELVTFDGMATDPDEDDRVSHVWSFGDGGGANLAHATHRYLQPGGFDAILAASDGLAEASSVVHVDVASATTTVTKLTLVERYREYLASAGGGGDDDGDGEDAGAQGGGGGDRETAADGKFRVTGAMALTAADVAALTADSHFRLGLGGALIDVTLGADPKYAPGATSARLVQVDPGDPDEGSAARKYLQLDLDWSSGTLTFRLDVLTSQRFRSFADAVLGPGLVGRPSGKRTGVLPGAVTFGPASATFGRPYRAKVGTVDRDRGGRHTYRSQVKIKAKGALAAG
ncbi:MAG TPA: PKD domain-containing protein [Candidatus Binatia bacterium]|nr:PKD domain-containing protein [Candidatus Binatia bacterium]